MALLYPVVRATSRLEFICMLIYIHQCVALIREMYSKGPKLFLSQQWQVNEK